MPSESIDAPSRTLCIIKPDAVERNAVGSILGRLSGSGLRPVTMRMLRLTDGVAATFYKVHQGRPFYDELVRFMASGPVVVAVLEARDGVDAVAAWRKLMGATDPARQEIGTIRKAWATSIMFNAVHGSDSPENAAREIAFFFGDIAAEPPLFTMAHARSGLV